MTLCTLPGPVADTAADLAGAHPALDQILLALIELDEATGLEADATGALISRLAGEDSVLTTLLPQVLRSLVTGPAIAALPYEQRTTALAQITALAAHLEALPTHLADAAAAAIDPYQP
ncbi:hypothetical protein [Streptomyces sp. NPDC017529]|uniref:hypothetical protein n=1 Tax=Streptomyces sp. NPDC017529 TaxID=3365000 RepID=UPI003797B144